MPEIDPKVMPQLRLTPDKVEAWMGVLGLELFFFDLGYPERDTPRLAKVSGVSALDGHAHITIFANPEHDYEMAPTFTRRDVLLIWPGESVPQGLDSWALVAQTADEG